MGYYTLLEKPMKERFLINLCRVLGHTLWYEEHKCGVTLMGCGGPDVELSKPADPSSLAQAQLDVAKGMIPLVTSAVPKLAEAEWQATQKYAPLQSQLQTQLFQQQMPLLNQVSRDITTQNMLAQAEAEKQVAQGPGRALTQEALATAKLADPEFYALRELLGGKLAEQIRNPVTGGEYEALQRGINQQNVNTGNTRVPTNVGTVVAAQQYGNQYQNRLNDALNRATQALPQLKSGMDVFQQATGRAGMVDNQAQNAFKGAESGNNVGQASSTLTGAAGAISGPFSGYNSALQQYNSNQINNAFNPFQAGLFGGLGNTLGSVFGMSGNNNRRQ